MKTAVASILLTASASFSFAAIVPQSVDGDDGFGVFSSSGGSGSNSGTFTAPNSDTGPGDSWGFFANSGETSEALYDINGGALTVGQSINIQMDNGNIQTGGTVGLGFQNIANVNNRLEFFFVGGEPNYTYLDSSSNNSGVPFTNSGLDLTFELTGTDSYALTITPIGGSPTNVSGTLGGTAGTGVDRVRLFNFNAGTGSGSDAYFNNLEVVPEPSSYAMIGGLLALGAALLQRRRKS